MRVGLLSIASIIASIAGVASPSFAVITAPAASTTPLAPAAAADVPALNLPASAPIAEAPTLPHNAPVIAAPAVVPNSISTAEVPPPLPPSPHNNLPNMPAGPHHPPLPPPANSRPEIATPLAGSLPPGMRAVSIPAETSSGLVTHMIAGDRIDVLVTHNGQGKPITTEVLMSNAPVLAANVGRDDATTSVTVEADNTQVQKLFVAEKTGTLSLALRSAADKDEDDIAKPVSLDGPTVPKVIKHVAKRHGTKTHVAETHAVVPEDSVVKIIRGTGTQESKE